MERTDRFLLFISLSLLLHLIIFYLLKSSGAFEPRAVETAEKSLKIKLNSNNRQQVVKTDQPESLPPEDAKFLSEYNRRTEQEMRAAHSGRFRNNPGTVEGEIEKSESQKKDADLGDSKSIPRITDLLKPSQIGQRSQTYDDVDRPLGDQTMLNTREFIYASFFNRVKELIGPIWERRIEDVIRKSGSSLRVLNYTTVLHVTLNREGEVLDVDVLHPAVNRDFDSAASDSFWEARKFPNPPSGLYEGKKVASFDFSFSVDLQESGAVFLRTVPDPRYFLPPGENVQPFLPPTRVN